MQVIILAKILNNNDLRIVYVFLKNDIYIAKIIKILNLVEKNRKNFGICNFFVYFASKFIER